MIEGIRHSRTEKQIWAHNSPADLDRNVALEAEEFSTPGQPADGGYWARLQKK